MHFNLQDCVICFALLIYSFLVLFYILINCFFFTHVNCYHHPQKYCSLLLIYYSFTTTPTLHNAKNISIIKQQSFKTRPLFAFAFTSKHPPHTPLFISQLVEVVPILSSHLSTYSPSQYFSLIFYRVML